MNREDLAEELAELSDRVAEEYPAVAFVLNVLCVSVQSGIEGHVAVLLFDFNCYILDRISYWQLRRN